MFNLKNLRLLETRALIGSQWVETDLQFDVRNPATEEIIARVSNLGREETLSAIQAANNALEDWKSLNVKERSRVLYRWYELIMENKDDLATILTAEQGKPIQEARGEIAYGASFVQWYAEEAKRAYGDIIPSTIDNARTFAIKQPVGVCALITPWNFPCAMITRKVAPALAAGCTVICKPAEDTPLTALALCVLAKDAGIPDGVINMITTTNSKEVGEILCENKIVRKLSFTGSTAVGKILMRQCASNVKKISLELGGNAPFIVFPDADINEAVKGAIACKFRNAGQVCITANRFYIHDDIYDEFCSNFVKAVEALNIGNGLDSTTNIGPLINAKGINKVAKLVSEANENGANILIGGKKSDKGNNFYEPTILTNVNIDMQLSCEEIFGPVAPLYKFSTEDEVLHLANNVEYGLAAYFYATDISQVWRVAEKLEFGMVGINSGIISSESVPFGGIKESGIGREGGYQGMDEYLEEKYILISG